MYYNIGITHTHCCEVKKFTQANFFDFLPLPQSQLSFRMTLKGFIFFIVLIATLAFLCLLAIKSEDFSSLTSERWSKKSSQEGIFKRFFYFSHNKWHAFPSCTGLFMQQSQFLQFDSLFPICLLSRKKQFEILCCGKEKRRITLSTHSHCGKWRSFPIKHESTQTTQTRNIYSELIKFSHAPKHSLTFMKALFIPKQF